MVIFLLRVNLRCESFFVVNVHYKDCLHRLLLNLSNVVCESLSSLRSSDILCCKFGAFLAAYNLSKVKGSKTRSDKFLTLLNTTYVIPVTFSDFPRSIQAFSNVRPWHLWIVIAQANRKGSCCFSAL